jgi:hypothetical protein
LEGNSQLDWFGLTMHAAAGGVRYALHARDAVVHGDEEVGLALRGDVHQLGRQAIAELEAVWHEVADVSAEGP